MHTSEWRLPSTLGPQFERQPRGRRSKIVKCPNGRLYDSSNRPGPPQFNHRRWESRVTWITLYIGIETQKLGRICKTEGSWTKTWPLEQLCAMCAPLVRSLLPFSFFPTPCSLLVFSSLRLPACSLPRCHHASTSFPIAINQVKAKLVGVGSPANWVGRQPVRLLSSREFFNSFDELTPVQRD